MTNEKRGMVAVAGFIALGFGMGHLFDMATRPPAPPAFVFANNVFRPDPNPGWIGCRAGKLVISHFLLIPKGNTMTGSSSMATIDLRGMRPEVGVYGGVPEDALINFNVCQPIESIQ